MDTTNEPVAWMLLSDESCVELTEWFGVMRGWEDFLGDNQKIVELYTHPVKELTDEEIRELGRMSRKWQDPYVWLAKRINRPLKDLTNKEIQEVITEHEWYGWTLEQFARAILRKAQEK